MKKTFITASALILSIAFVAVAFIFSAPVAYASEVDTIAPPMEENVTEGKNSASTDIPAQSENTTTEQPLQNSSTATDAQAETRISSLVDSITNSSLWVSIGSYILAAIAVISFVAKKFGAISEMIKNKADKSVITAEIKSGVKEMREVFDDEYQKINAELEQHQEKEKQMWAMLTIFMTHAKIPSSAKAEIMNCITGIKDMTGDIKEIVESAEKAICAAEKEAAENATPTPALDEIINTAAVSNVMELG